MIRFQNGLEMFCFPVVKSSFSFRDVKIVTIPTTSFETVLVWKVGFDASGVLKNNFTINKRVETIYTRFKTFNNMIGVETNIR